MEEVLNLVCGEGTWDWEHATTERGDRLGYDMMYSEDELTVTEVVVSAPAIVEYLKWLQQYDLKSEDCNEFHSLASELVTNKDGWGDYQVFESFVARDYSGIVMLFTDYGFVDFSFSESLMSIMDYCERQLKIKKEGELIIDGTLNA